VNPSDTANESCSRGTEAVRSPKPLAEAAREGGVFVPSCRPPGTRRKGDGRDPRRGVGGPTWCSWTSDPEVGASTSGRELRRGDPEWHDIMLTGAWVCVGWGAAWRSGDDDYIVKPFLRPGGDGAAGARGSSGDASTGVLAAGEETLTIGDLSLDTARPFTWPARRSDDRVSRKRGSRLPPCS